jgi:hypothetical protein
MRIIKSKLDLQQNNSIRGGSISPYLTTHVKYGESSLNNYIKHKQQSHLIRGGSINPFSSSHIKPNKITENRIKFIV